PQNGGGAVDVVNAFLQKVLASGRWGALGSATVGEVMEGEAPGPPVPGELPAGPAGADRPRAAGRPRPGPTGSARRMRSPSATPDSIERPRWTPSARTSPCCCRA